MDNMVVKLKANHEEDRAHLMVGLKDALKLLMVKDAHVTHSEKFAMLMGEASEALIALEKNF